MKNFKLRARLTSSLTSLSLLTSLTVTGACAFGVSTSASAQTEDEVITVGSLIRRPAQADRASPVVSKDALSVLTRNDKLRVANRELKNKKQNIFKLQSLN